MSITYLDLQHYWWFLISLLGAILVFLMFVQGGQTLIYSLGKTEKERTLLVNALGRKWEFTFTTLVTFGGAFFASFPLFYSTSFGGAYWVWMIILFAFVIQAVSYEFRTKPKNIYGKKTFEVFLFVNGLLGTILLGTAVATFFTASPFSVNEYNFSKWDSSFRGLELAFNFARYETYINLSLGLSVFFLARLLALLYFLNNVSNTQIIQRSRKYLLYNFIPFLVFFLFFLINIILIDGYAYDENGKVFIEPFKYLHNLIEVPLTLIFLILGVVGVLYGILSSLIKMTTKGIWFSGIGTILTVLALFFLVGYNRTAFYPSYSNIQSSLTIENASSSFFTLSAMSYVSIMIPFVLAYIIWAWRSMNKKKISESELEKESHVY
ncbi:MAG: cytochrome d ubiquinol oxidase subunit II [Bacteroidales bacterium]